MPAGTSLQVFLYRTNYACKEIPVGMYLSADFHACGGLQVLTHRDRLTGIIIPVKKDL
jgi:hypothetical protein